MDVLKTSTLSRRLHTKIAIALLTLGLTLNNCATITLSKPGYKTVTTSGMSSISGGGGTAMAGNLLLGGIIGEQGDGGPSSPGVAARGAVVCCTASAVASPIKELLGGVIGEQGDGSPSSPGVAARGAAAVS